MNDNDKTPVGERALHRRINRKLAKQHEAVRSCRARTRAYNHLGRYHLLDIHRNQVLDSHIDIQTLGRKLGVMGEEETLKAK
jgi:hypothetical protein